MSKVSVKLGLTLPGPQDYSSFRADFAISEVDTDGDVEQQIADAIETGTKVSEGAESGLAKVAVNVSGISLEGMGVGQQFIEFKEKFGPAWKKLKEQVEELAAQAEPTKKPAKKSAKKTKK